MASARARAAGAPPSGHWPCNRAQRQAALAQKYEQLFATAAVDPRNAFLLGDPAAGIQAERVRQAIWTELGVDARCVPVFILDSVSLRRLHRLMGGEIGATFELEGFHTRGQVFIRRSLGMIKDSVLVHETLHALSPRFTEQATARGFTNLVEGMTQFFTREVATRQLGLAARDIVHAYGGYVEFAEQLAARLSRSDLAEVLFASGFARLEQLADATLGEGVLARAAAALERKDFGAAISMLQVRR